MIIPWKMLEEEKGPEVLDSLIAEYITTEMATLNDEVSDMKPLILKVRKQLESGAAVIEFSQVHKNTYIVSADKFKK